MAIEQELVFKAIIFRGPCTRPWSVILREVADYLDSAPDIEEAVEFMKFDSWVSEPTPETEPDCEQMHEATIYASVPKAFHDAKIKELVK